MEKRRAGDYEIIHAFHIGDKEIVIGENVNTIGDERYMCAYCDRNEIFGLYSDLWCSDDFCEVVKKYSDRLSEQAEKTRQELRTPILQGIDITPVLKAECTPISSEDNLNGKIVVIKQDVLRQEYRRSTHQIKLCTGGFGAYPNSRGSACYCVDLYTRKTHRYERQDIMGTLRENQLPKWAAMGLERYQQEQKQKSAKSKEER